MQFWLVVGYVGCFFALACGVLIAMMERGGALRGILVTAGALVGLALVRSLEEIFKRLPPRGAAGEE